MKLIFATHNIGKVKEMRALLVGLNIEVVSADEAGVHEDVVEDGATFEANAAKKASFTAERTGEWVVADDSGLCVEALGYAPGVFSARWAGEGASDETMVNHALAAMKDVPEGKRGAWFECALALRAPDHREWIFKGKVSGRISLERRGLARKKLPYDQIFIPDGHNRTFAEMPDEQKNTLSHRGLAFKKLHTFIADHLLEGGRGK